MTSKADKKKSSDDLPTMQPEGTVLEAYMQHVKNAEDATEVGDVARAVIEYEAAVMMRPNMFQPHMMLGELMIQRGDNGEAFRHFSKAYELQPENVYVLINLAELMVRFGEIEQAKGIVCDAIAIDDENAPAICLLANLLAYEKDFEQATTLLQCAIDNDPEEWSFWHTIAMIQLDQEDPKNAKIFFDEARRLNPTAKILKDDYEAFKAKYPAEAESEVAH